MCVFPVVCRHLQGPPCALDPSVPSSPLKPMRYMFHSVNMRVFEGYVVLKRNIGRVEREIVALVSIEYF
jgi:hypothetical protein